MKNIAGKKNKKRIYMDHAATTYLDPRVASVMKPYWDEDFGNASSLYREGRRAKKALDGARASIADLIGTAPEEIIFTGGGTEGDNMAIFGAVQAYRTGGQARPPDRQARGKAVHIITTKIEHHAILEPLRTLQKDGVEITYLDVDEDGIVNPEAVKKALRPDTVLVSVMYANNEIGTIQPIAEIAEIIKNFKAKNFASQYPLFHTDACQAAGYLDMNVKNLGVDLMTVNGSKMYGPKGVGFLYKKSGVKLAPILYGGGQEKRLRSGTENIPAIIGLAKAFEIAQKERAKELARLTKLRDMFIAGILKNIPKVVLNGHPKKRLPNNVNVSILDIEGEGIILYLDEYGIAASTGSACTSADLEPSHVILALGRPYEFAHASLRFTLGRRNNEADIKYALNVLPEIVRILRGISPLKIKADSKGVSHPEAFAGTVTKNSYR